MRVSEKLIDQDTIAEIVDKVFELREHWTLRGNYFEEIPFYSLGAAAYMDIGENGLEAYSQAFKKTNELLKDNFAALYDLVFNELEKVYDAKFELFENSAYPGFHVFLTDDVFEIALASRHCDLQYKNIDWQGIKVDPSRSISFTLYLELPKNGGGVYYWKRFYEELRDLEIKEREENLHKAERFYKSFNVGDLFIHNGHQYHQIAPFFDIEENDRRISLQGHAIYSPDLNKYLVHW